MIHRLTGVVCRGQGLVSQILARNPEAWRPALPTLHPGSINLYIPGNHFLFEQGLLGAPPTRSHPCQVNGVAAFIMRTQFPEPTFGPRGDHTVFEIVAPTKIDGIGPGATLSLEYEWP